MFLTELLKEINESKMFHVIQIEVRVKVNTSHKNISEVSLV